eukprot:6970747-Pyramimonas_sp.AAC.1
MRQYQPSLCRGQCTDAFCEHPRARERVTTVARSCARAQMMHVACVLRTSAGHCYIEKAQGKTQ